MTVAGILIEVLTDARLTRFRRNPANRDTDLDTGLWGWSRHPNYFGDILMWWGYFVVAIAGGTPLSIILGPIVMSVLLFHYSGASLMEDTIETFSCLGRLRADPDAVRHRKTLYAEP